MGVGAHLHRVVALPLVHEHVHVAHDRVADLVAGFSQQVDRSHVGHLVHRRGERDVGAGQGGHTRAPYSAGDHHLLHLEPTAVGHHGADARPPERRPRNLQPGDFGVVQHREHALGQGPLAHDGARPYRVHHRHARHVEAALDHLAVDERDPGHHLVGGEQLRLDAPGAGRGHAPPQLLHALLGARHLHPAAGGVDPQRLILALALQGQQRDLAVVIGRKDEVGGVAGGAARVGQRPLVDQHQLVHPSSANWATRPVADDAGADYRDLRARRHYTGIRYRMLTHGCHLWELADARQARLRHARDGCAWPLRIGMPRHRGDRDSVLPAASVRSSAFIRRLPSMLGGSAWRFSTTERTASFVIQGLKRRSASSSTLWNSNPASAPLRPRASPGGSGVQPTSAAWRTIGTGRRRLL